MAEVENDVQAKDGECALQVKGLKFNFLPQVQTVYCQPHQNPINQSSNQIGASHIVERRVVDGQIEVDFTDDSGKMAHLTTKGCVEL